MTDTRFKSILACAIFAIIGFTIGYGVAENKPTHYTPEKEFTNEAMEDWQRREWGLNQLWWDSVYRASNDSLMRQKYMYYTYTDRSDFIYFLKSQLKDGK